MSINKNKTFRVLKDVVLVAALILVATLYFNEKNLRAEQETLIEGSLAELQVWKNKDGENVAKIQVLETSNAKTFLALESQNEAIQQLQRLVKENRKLFKDSNGTAGVITSETDINAGGVTEVTEDVDNDPIYSATIEDKWYKINSRATKDSTTISLKTYHNLSIVVGSESQGFFKKKKTFATAKDANPYSNITDMRIYNVTQKQKNFIVGPYVGYGLTKVGNTINTGFQVGIGVTYKLIEF
jgi:hypothetical protein